MAALAALQVNCVPGLSGSLKTESRRKKNVSCSLSSHISASLAGFSSSGVCGQSSDFCGIPLVNATKELQKFRFSSPSRSVVTMVIPFQRGPAHKQPPPDIASFIFKHRIIYLGMPFVPAVTELIIAQLLYLQRDEPSNPIYLYINSTGITKDGEKLGYEQEAISLYDLMSYVRAPIYTLAIGNAWGEAALLLAAGAKGNRAALPSAKIMLRQPIGRFRGQASDIDIQRKEMRAIKESMLKMYSDHIGRPAEEISEDIRRPKYFTPEEAIEYGIIDKILESPKDESGSLIAEFKRKNII